jgi:uncharacterized protein YkwD/LysM repeat protein
MKILLAGALALSCCLSHVQAQCPNQSRTGVHVIQPGETLYRLSKQYGLTLTQLCTWNNMTIETVLPLCTEIRVSDPANTASYTPAATTQPDVDVDAKGPEPTSTSSSSFYVVNEGESVKQIAELFGFTERKFREMNNLPSDVQYLLAGSMLKVSDCNCPSADDTTEAKRRKLGGGQPVQPATTTSGNTPKGPANNTGTATTVRPNNTTTSTTAQPQQTTGFDQPQFNRPAGSGFRPRSTTQLGTTTTQSEPFDNTSAPVAKPTAKPTVAPKPASQPSYVSASSAISNANYMTQEEQYMCLEINRIRSNPQGYIADVETFINEMRTYDDFESIEAAKELIGVLRNMSPVSELQPASCLVEAMQLHAADQRPTGDLNHKGTDGRWPWDRAMLACPDVQDGAENIVGGPDDYRRGVMLLMVDSGIPSRGHRTTLLDPRWTSVGCHRVGLVGDMPNCWLQMYAQ